MTEGVKFSNKRDPAIVTTQPDRILRHSISDEELSELCSLREDRAVEIFWAAFGVFGGTVGSLAAFFQSVSAAKVVAWGQAIEALVCFAAIGVGLLAGWFWYRRHKRVGSLEDRIRNQGAKAELFDAEEIRRFYQAIRAPMLSDLKIKRGNLKGSGSE